MNIGRLVPSGQCRIFPGTVQDRRVLLAAFPEDVGATDIVVRLVPMGMAGVRRTVFHASEVVMISVVQVLLHVA